MTTGQSQTGQVADASSRPVSLQRAEPKRYSPAWRIKIRQRERQALDLHLAGVDFVRIAEQLGYYDASGAYKAVHRLLARVETEGADQLRAVRGARLERLMVAVWPAAVKGDLKAVAEARRLDESYRRLFGLDAPVKIEGTLRDATQVAIEELAQQLGMTAGPASLPVE